MKKYLSLTFIIILTGSCTVHKSQVSATNIIRIMSYNVRHCSPPATGLIDIDGTAAAIKNQNPDIVALQEIDVNTGRDGKIDEAVELGKKTGMNVYFGKAIDYGGGEYGVAILSKYNLINPVVHKLPTLESTKGEHRVLLTAEIRLPGGKSIMFGTTHLDAQGPPTNRDLQIKEIIDIAKTIKLPFILAGDLNAQPGTNVINKLDQHFTRSCQTCGFTIPADRPNKTIDYISFTPGSDFKVISHEVIVEPKVSDHAPILAVLKY
ncbi:endonuclease/exonuclease/phosphatase family protein [Mucilaginibacter sp. UYCu711]|uniref:endonuclease/exonuclease/phosphatase family protein n=1 Tax=Mucilaginibacter sp. UYCu711 TaxID=3156339 RepID=UPI003D21E6C3